jgi:hypothetical protein
MPAVLAAGLHDQQRYLFRLRDVSRLPQHLPSFQIDQVDSGAEQGTRPIDMRR